MPGRHYDRRSWRRLREAIIKTEPLCRMCRDIGKTKLANCVDHIVPIRDGGTDARDNLQPLCSACHSGAKAVLERTGKVKGCDEHGLPFDPNHLWRQ